MTPGCGASFPHWKHNLDRVVVITGSTRGLGFGLADAFLARNCSVALNGRTAEAVTAAQEQLVTKHGHARVHAHPGSVANYDTLAGLWTTTCERFGRVDIWINNAGLSHPLLPVWEIDPRVMASVVEANTLGALYGTRVAVQGMLAQGSGHLYNVEGFGSDGRMRAGQALYGMTKYALRYLNRALQKEAEEAPVQISTIRPGIVITDLLMEPIDDAETARQARRVFNILGERVERVAPWLVERILANNRSQEINYLTTWRVFTRFLLSPFRKRDLFTTDYPRSGS